MAKARAGGPRVNAETVRRMERATGALGTAAIAAMDKRLPWFRSMSAENRSWLGLVAQAAIAAFLDWIKHPERNRPAVTQVFGTAPPELARAVSLQHAVEMMRVIIDAVEAQVGGLARLAGVQGNRVIVGVGGSDDPIAAAERFAGRFGPGPVIAGPLVRDLRTASISARAALAALRAAPAWPDAPRPAGADDLLPERALDGDPDARAALLSS